MSTMTAGNEATRTVLKAVAYETLVRVGSNTPDATVNVRARNSAAEVHVTLRPLGDDPVARRIGKWMSPTETLITLKLGSEAMTRIDLARRCGMAYDPRFKTLVSNLIDRGILADADEGRGVRNAAAEV